MGLISEGISGIFKAATNGKGLGGFVTETLQRAGVLKVLTPEEQLSISQEANKMEVEKLTGDNETIRLINQSIQTEANSEHFLVYSWRPLTAYGYLLMLLANYVVCPLLKIPIATIPDQVHYTVLAILGVASFFRGQMQVADTKNQTK